MVYRKILAAGIASVSLIAAAGFGLTPMEGKNAGREMKRPVPTENQAAQASASPEIIIPSPKRMEYAPAVSLDDGILASPLRYEEYEVDMLAKTVWGEAGGCSRGEQRLVAWTVFQRVDAGIYGGDTIEDVITAPSQFVGYREDHPIGPEIYEMCLEEVKKWQDGEEPPTLAPYAASAPYFFFYGDGMHNWFREDYAK